MKSQAAAEDKYGELLDALADLLAERVQKRISKTWTADELAERYGCSKTTIRRRIQAGEFGDVIHVGARTHVVTAEGVRHFDETHCSAAHPRPANTIIVNRRRHIDPGPI